MTVGFRFDRRDLGRLSELVRRGQSENLYPESLALFRRAADDCRRGEPMKVECESIAEAQAFAQAFSFYGVTPPLIHQLSGA